MASESSDTVHPQGEADGDTLCETIMAIDMKESGQVGCAYYVAIEEALCLQEDIAMAGMELVETLLLHAQPTTVIITNRAPDKLIEYLESGAQRVDSDQSSDINGVYALRTVGSSEFNYNAGKERLLNLNSELFGPQSTFFTSVAEDDMDDAAGASHDGKQSKLMRLATHINLDSHLSIGCAGAVLNELQRRQAAKYLPDDPDAILAFRVRSIKMLSLADSMFANADTLAALQILSSESHPNGQMQGPDKSKSGAKENLSVYGLFKFLASTSQGKARLRQMFLRPSLDLDLIHERQRTISVLLRPENSQVLSSMVKMLRKVKNVKTSVLHLRKGVDLPSRIRSVKKGVWMALSRFALVSIELREAVRTLSGGENLAIASRVVNEIEPRDIVRVGEMIHSVIDFDQSMESNRTAVRRGVNAELDDLKHKYDGLDDFLSQVAARLAQVIPEWACEYVQNCIFYPQLGFLTVVSLNPETGRGNYEGEGLVGDIWETMFVNEGHVYYKNTMMKELDEQVGDIFCMIVDKEIEIIHELGTKVLGHEDAMIAASDLFGELDSFIALALGAERYRWTIPRMTRKNVVKIQGGRHPLQELVVPSFIANDCGIHGGCGARPEEDEDMSIDGEEVPNGPSMLVLTGPNHSGKSVYLKQVALIVYLAHIGSYVPAEQATIGLTDRILTRIATRESVSRSESAFSIDLRQAAFSMNFVTRRSLVLIDEFGKGTNANNGAGLMTALLDHFLSLGEETPKTLAASHFHEIFENGFLEEDDNLAFAHMAVRVDLETTDPENQVTYLFQLVPGRSTSSFGSICAAMNGVDSAVVDRAEALVLLLARNEDLQAACAKLSDEEERKLEEAEAVARRFIEMDIPTPPLRRGGMQRVTPDVDLFRHMLRDLVSPRRGSGSSP